MCDTLTYYTHMNFSELRTWLQKLQRRFRKMRAASLGRALHAAAGRARPSGLRAPRATAAAAAAAATAAAGCFYMSGAEEEYLSITEETLPQTYEPEEIARVWRAHPRCAARRLGTIARTTFRS